jgi:hypothetical protein
VRPHQDQSSPGRLASSCFARGLERYPEGAKRLLVGTSMSVSIVREVSGNQENQEVRGGCGLQESILAASITHLQW